MAFPDLSSFLFGPFGGLFSGGNQTFYTGGQGNNMPNANTNANAKTNGTYNPVRTFEQPEQSWSEWLFGSPEKIQQIQQFDPRQQKALQQLLQMGLSGLDPLASQYINLNRQQRNGFAPIAQEARQQFETQGVPSLTERFTAAFPGASSAQRSSAFPAALGAARAGLESSLASLGAQHGQRQQALQLQGLQQFQSLLSNLLNTGLRQQYETLNRPQTGGFAGQAVETGARVLPALLPLLL
jgi:hypothetical protein